MILPEKHIKFCESLLGLGAYILKMLNGPKTVDAIWIEFSRLNNTKEFPTYHGFDNIVLAVDYLYIIGAIRIKESGEIYNAAP